MPRKTTVLKLTAYQVDVLRFALYTQEQLFGEKIDNGSSQPGDMAEANCLKLLQSKLPEADISSNNVSDVVSQGDSN